MKNKSGSAYLNVAARLLPRSMWGRAAGGLVVLMFAFPVIADDLADVSKLLRAGQHAEALGKADAFLSGRPRDPQMRFLKGVILAEQNKPAEAIGMFTRLTEEFPDLPEPYNNLAVLYAASGQYEKARVALDKAIRTNPSYATAYENLGDIHAKLASQAYDKALQLDSKNNAAQSKLTLVRTLTAQPGAINGSMIAAAPVRPQQPVRASAPPPAPVVAAAEPKVVLPPPAEPRIAAAPKTAEATTAGSRKAEPVPAAPKPAARPEPKEQAPAAKPQPENNAERDAVLAAVGGWAKAWSARDVKGYLSYYASDFDTPKGMSRKAWTEERQARIAGKGSISVRVDSPQVVIKGNTATVKFRQQYISDRLTANSRKTLDLVKVRGKWQIQQERVGS